MDCYKKCENQLTSKLTCNYFFGAKIEPFCGHHKKKILKKSKN